MMNATESYKDYRKYLILNMIYHFQPVSRTRLVELTNFQPAIVTALVKDLVDMGYVMETGKSSNKFGRKRVLLEINKQHFLTILVSFSAENISYSVLQLDGTIRKVENVPFDLGCDRKALVSDIVSHISACIEAYPGSVIAGTALCDPLYNSPAYFQSDSPTSSYSKTLDWIANEVMPEIERLIPRPVRLFSPVTLPALSEKRYGQAVGYDNFICVELSNGIGSSFCVNGQVLSGNTGSAGEIGHTVVNAHGARDRICYCGKAGCLETYASFPVIVREIEKAIDNGTYSRLQPLRERGVKLTAKILGQAIAENDQLTIHYVKKAAELIGIAIANEVNLLNPKLVILFGFMLDLGDYFLQKLEESIRENVLSFSADFEIRVSHSLGQYLPLGAADEVFSDFFHMEDFRWVYKLAMEPEAMDD
ncbi:MAG: ROK family transcriptional regulator [Lachnospiraceae bacterium]|nr:ROK family transcriptional regulator [Lachnospiraceae bacterium]